MRECNSGKLFQTATDGCRTCAATARANHDMRDWLAEAHDEKPVSRGREVRSENPTAPFRPIFFRVGINRARSGISRLLSPDIRLLLYMRRSAQDAAAFVATTGGNVVRSVECSPCNRLPTLKGHPQMLRAIAGKMRGGAPPSSIFSRCRKSVSEMTCPPSASPFAPCGDHLHSRGRERLPLNVHANTHQPSRHFPAHPVALRSVNFLFRRRMQSRHADRRG